MKQKLKTVLILLLTLATVCAFTACGGDDDGNGELTFTPNISTVGVWWWHTSSNSGIDPDNIEFASANGVTEIYYATHSFSQRHADFVKRASQHDIKVYLLLGDWEWINDDEPLHDIIADYIVYQQGASADSKFAGIHLDVEPHQSPDFSVNRAQLLDKYLDFVINIVDTYPSIKFDFDIPFWFTDTVTYKDTIVPLYQAVISEAHRVFIMSYRTSADKIYNLGTVPQQIEYAKSLDKQIFLCVECAETDEDITFIDMGRAAMYAELNNLKHKVDYSKLGIAIHHMRAWLELKD